MILKDNCSQVLFSRSEHYVSQRSRHEMRFDLRIGLNLLYLRHRLISVEQHSRLF